MPPTADNWAAGPRGEVVGDGFWKQLDQSVEPQTRAEIDATLASFRGDAVRFDHVVTRRAGQRRFVDLHMHMPADWSLGQAASLRGSVEKALMAAVPGLRASIQLLPTDVEAHLDDPKDPP
jgi:divalent metal cation (Fe/Co/Zn/Cd) transporter